MSEPWLTELAGTADIRRWSSPSTYEPTIGYCRVIRAGGLFLTAGCTAATGPDGHPLTSAYEQARGAFAVALRALAEAGCPVEQVIQSRMYVTEAGYADEVGRAHAELFAAVRPVATMLVVSALIDPALLVEVELVGSA